MRAMVVRAEVATARFLSKCEYEVSRMHEGIGVAVQLDEYTDMSTSHSYLSQVFVRGLNSLVVCCQ